MTEYSGIRGTRVKYLSSNPTLNTSTEGQVWYNSTSGTLKALVGIDAWANGNLFLANPSMSGPNGFGAQTAGVLAGGSTPAPSPVLTNSLSSVYEYNNEVWSTATSMSQVRNTFGSAGPQTAGVVFGGRITGNPFTYTAATEEYNGTSWTGGGAMGATRYYMGSAGTQTAAFQIGGLQAGPNSKTETQTYNGSSWTSAPTLPTGVHANRGSGTNSATLSASAAPPADKNITMLYDGSSWSDGNNATASKAYRGASSLGTQTLSLLWGGEPFAGNTEQYNGTNWSNSANLTQPGYATQGGGTGDSGLAIGRDSPSAQASREATEEFQTGISSFTNAAWAGGGNLSNARAQFGSAKHGTQNAGLAFGGYVFGPNANLSATEEYGGASWTSGGALPAGQRQMGGSGTQTAAFGIGGQPGMPGTTTLEYDGSSWTAGGALPSGGNFMANNAAGTQTAGLRAGGGGGAETTVQKYDGSSWTSANSMSVARVGNYFDGVQTAAITTAGEAPSAPDASGSITKLTEEFDGTNWTSGAASIYYLSSGATSGGASAPTAWMVAGGDGPNVTNNTGITQEYNGTAFSYSAFLSTPRRQLSGGGTQAAGLVMGGTEASSSSLNATEEYTGSVTAVSASTLTTS